MDADLASKIRQQIALLRQKVQETGQELDRCRQEQEAFSMEFHSFREKNVQFESFVQQNGAEHPDVKRYRATKETMEKHIKEGVS